MSATENQSKETTANLAEPDAAEFAGTLSGPEWQPEGTEDEDTAPEQAREQSEEEIENAASLNDRTSAFSSASEEEHAPSAMPSLTDEMVPAWKEEEQVSKMTLMGHLNELRIRLVRSCMAVGIAFFACWAVVDPVFDTLVNPLLAALPHNSTAIYTTLPEGFFMRMFVAFVTSLFLASPVIFYQLWSFIAPGLYEEEKRAVIPIAFVSAVFFIAGGLFCYFMVFPYVFNFFVSFSTEDIVVMPKISDYLDFVFKLILAFGLIFEMPLFAFFLSRIGLVTAALMRSVRSYAVLVIFVVAAILTPPDVISQLLMACPMLLLYEISILVAAVSGRSKKADDAVTPSMEEA
ncbi:MAG: twin-arginine translocase subunit TatC [Desulfovibrio sp.]|jgi:sec-independent protein translocase protein TatC|nr:twin-arginine translocase subunit TatC [Desulfovibrio sp.]